MDGKREGEQGSGSTTQLGFDVWKRQGFYKDGKQEGEFKAYHDNGKLWGIGSIQIWV